MKKLVIVFTVIAAVVVSAILLRHEEANPRKALIDTSSAAAGERGANPTANGLLPMNEVRMKTKVRVRPTAEKVVDQDFENERNALVQQLEDLKKAGFGLDQPNSRVVLTQIEALDAAKNSVLKPLANDVVPPRPGEESKTRGMVGIVLDGPPLRVKDVLPESPASLVGMLPGDLLIGIDGTSLDGLSFERAYDLIKGSVGDPIRLTYRRPPGQQPREITFQRVPVPWLETETPNKP